MSPGRNEISVSGGANLDGESGIMMLSYRRFLGDWVSGRLRATLGVDLNLIGTGLEVGTCGVSTHTSIGLRSGRDRLQDRI